MRTAESGYLTRRLVDASQEVIVREEDCGTTNFILITKEEAEARGEPFDELVFGRVLAEGVIDQFGNEVVKAGEMITKENRDLINDMGVDMLKVRSALVCDSVNGVCQKCFGMDLSSRELIQKGTPIGVIASQSIGEPGTQLTMRTFHT